MDNADREPGDMDKTEKLDRELADLVARIQAGDKAAEEQFIREYGEYVRIIIRRQRAVRSSRSRRDEDDYYQSVCVAVVIRLRDGTSQITNRAEARAVLAQEVDRNVIKHLRLNRAQRRDIGREEAGAQDLELPGREPDPAEEVDYEDLEAALLARLPLRERLVLQGRLDGRAWVQIARDTGCSIQFMQARLAHATCRALHAMGLPQLFATIMRRARRREA